jgi:hypothetical protein
MGLNITTRESGNDVVNPPHGRGDAISEKDSTRESAVDGIANVYVLHRVLYPQVHDNGERKKYVVNHGKLIWRP